MPPRDTHRALAARLRDAGIEPDVSAPMTEAERAQAVAAFCESPDGAALCREIGQEAARRWTDVVARHGADDERGRPLRVGGWKTEEFLFAIVDQEHDLSAQDAGELAATARAWTDWSTHVTKAWHGVREKTYITLSRQLSRRSPGLALAHSLTGSERRTTTTRSMCCAA